MPSPDLTISLPPDVLIGLPSKEVETREKTALWIPTSVRDRLPFKPSKNFPNVSVLDDPVSLFSSVVHHGRFDRRYGEGGLEDNPTRQQIIIYSMVTVGDHILVYQRASTDDVQAEDTDKLGDSRLRGRVSVGFGGHTSANDHQEHMIENGILATLMPIVWPGVVLGTSLTRARLVELKEELGIPSEAIEDFKFLGGFFETFSEEELSDPKNIPVGSVHTGICGLVTLNPYVLRDAGLVCQRTEIAAAQWYPKAEVIEAITAMKAQGRKVESWTDIVLNEFLPPLLGKT